MLRIECLHGYFKFIELKSGEVSQFKNIYGMDLVRHPQGYFTFPFLLNAPKYSIEGSKYLDADATKTFEGNPWDVMRANSLIYNFVSGEVVKASEIEVNLLLNESTFYFFSNGLVLPGSLTKNGGRVVDYTAFFIRDTGKFKYSAVGYV